MRFAVVRRPADAGILGHMRLTHFGHSCVLVQTDDARILFDPGTYSSGFERLSDLAAIVITHQHPDHVDVDRLALLLAANPQAELLIEAATRPVLDATAAARRARVVAAGDELLLGGTTVTAVGGAHATIHADIPVIPNLGYVVDDGAFYHPGDSFFVPDVSVDVLAAPVSGPWLKISEAIDFVRVVKPRVAVPIHELTLARPEVNIGLLTNLAATEVTRLPHGTATTLA